MALMTKDKPKGAAKKCPKYFHAEFRDKNLLVRWMAFREMVGIKRGILMEEAVREYLDRHEKSSVARAINSSLKSRSEEE
jgi:hypothetical protein